MLSFSTEFPITNDCEVSDFVDVIKAWIAASPHTQFRIDDLAKFGLSSDGALEKDAEKVRWLRVGSKGNESVAIQHTNNDQHIDWLTTIVLSSQVADAWVGIRVERESSRPAVMLPPAKKPIIVRNLLEKFGGAPDGTLPIAREAFSLGNDDIALAARLISGQGGCYLPVIYVSAPFGGEPPIDAAALASDLSGMAHVVVEPNRPFSRRLQIDVDSDNVYGGTVGIYWPDEGGRRAFFIGHQFENASEIKRAIVEEVRTALLNRRPLRRCTLAAVQEAASRHQLNELKQSGSSDIEKYIVAFDSEIKANAEALLDAEREIARLRAEIRKHEGRPGISSELALRAGVEQDLYPGELAEIVRDAIEDAAARVQPDSRREHVLRAILAATLSDDAAKTNREELKRLLREYSNMDKKTKKGLEDLGFSVTEDGKHFKLIFGDDDRYTFSLSKSGSDHRGGLNAASDIAKRLF